MKERRKRKLGQGLTEYIIVVALVAISAIGVVSLFGDDVRMLFAGSANALAGEEQVTLKTQTAHQDHYRHKGLERFATMNYGAH